MYVCAINADDAVRMRLAWMDVRRMDGFVYRLYLQGERASGLGCAGLGWAWVSTRCVLEVGGLGWTGGA